MLRGQIDSVAPSGLVSGWACDLNRPCAGRLISITNRKGEELGVGLSNRFRQDLVEAKIGTGWHGFVIRVPPVRKSAQTSLRLIDKTTGVELHTNQGLPVNEEQEQSLDSIQEMIAEDPTIIRSIGELAGCERIFDKVIRCQGVGSFVKLAYVYVLGRAADPVGLALYSKKIRRGEISPFALVNALASSDEFQSRPRQLSSPSTPGFPFAWAE